VPGSRQPPPQQPGTENSSGPPAGPHIEEPATRRLVERFAAAIPAVAAAHAAHVRRTVPAYARHDQKDTVVGDVAANTRQTYELLVRALHGDPVSDEDHLFIRVSMIRRFQAGLNIDDYLHAWRLGIKAAWAAIAAEAEDDEERVAAFGLVRLILDFLNTSSMIVASAYREVVHDLAAVATGARAEALDSLLAGRLPGAGPPEQAARTAGLRSGAGLLVVCAQPMHVNGEYSDALASAAGVIGRAASRGGWPLASPRDGQIVAVVAAGPDRGVGLSDALRAVQRSLAATDLVLGIGTSTIVDEVADLPHARAEATRASRSVSDADPVLALFELRPLDYLLRTADATTQRLVRPKIRRVIEEDLAADGVLTTTLLAYIAADLNAKLAADHLHVHPNTAYTRLARIAERTGCDLRRIGHVDDLRIAIGLARGKAPFTSRAGRADGCGRVTGLSPGPWDPVP